MTCRLSITDVLSFLALLFAAAFIVLHLNRGLNTTDEGYYLLCATYPDLLAQGSQFGDYTGLLFRLAGYNVTLFRLMGFAALLAAGLFFALKAEETLAPRKTAETPERSGRMGRISAIALGVLSYYGLWLTTPSYNWLNLVSLLLVLAALLGAAGTASEMKTRRRTAAWGVLLGAAGMMSFMARPLTAAVLACIAFLWTIAAVPAERRVSFLLSAGAAAVFVFFLHILLLEESLQAYLREMSGSLLLNRNFGEYAPERILIRAWNDIYFFLARFVKVVGPFFLGLIIAAIFMRLIKVNPRVRGWIANLSLLAFWGILVLLEGSVDFWKTGFMGLACCLGFFLTQAIFYPGQLRRGNSRRFSAALLFIGAGGAFAFSSGNGLMLQMSMAFGLLAAAGISITAGFEGETGNKNSSGVVCLLLSASALLILYCAYQKPYLLPEPLAAQTEPVTLSGERGTLKVDPFTKQYIEGLQRAAEGSGWVPGTPLLDLTENPGAAFILNAVPPVTAWLYGKRYEKVTKAALEMADVRELRRAWVLAAAEKAQRRWALKVSKAAGLNFPDAYEPAGEVLWKYGKEKQTQILWKPKT